MPRAAAIAGRDRTPAAPAGRAHQASGAAPRWRRAARAAAANRRCRGGAECEGAATVVTLMFGQFSRYHAKSRGIIQPFAARTGLWRRGAGGKALALTRA